MLFSIQFEVVAIFDDIPSFYWLNEIQDLRVTMPIHHQLEELDERESQIV
jgi:hypothetical protein